MQNKKAKRCSLCHRKAGRDKKHGYRIEVRRTRTGRTICDWCENECMEGVNVAEEVGLIEVKRYD